MRPSLGCYRTILPVLLVVGLSAPVLGLSNRVFVSPLGKDSASCGAFATPCKTLAGGVGQVSPGGTVLVVLPGEFGPVTITKALTIEAPTGLTALVQATSTAVTINAGPSDVVSLRGLVLASNSRAPQGVLVNSAGAVHIEKCVISGFIDAVFAYAWSSGKLFVTDTTARSNDQGVHASTGTGLLNISIERCVFESNNFGILTQDGTRTAVRGTVASGNIGGMAAQGFFGGLAELTVTDCLVTNNSSAGISSEGDAAGSSALVRVSGSTVTGNQRGFVQAEFGGTSTFFSRGDNTVEGNTDFDTFGTIQIYSGK